MKNTAHSHWTLSLKSGYRFINQKPTFSIWKLTGCTYFDISQMLQPWKGDSITSHGVPVTHCEQATILVLKLKVVQLRKFSFPPNIFFSFLLFLSIAWISSESDFLRVVLFPRVCFAPHWVFQRICIMNTMHSIDRIYQHDMHSEDSNHIFPSWHPTWKSFALFLRGLRTDVHGQLFAMLRRISCTPFGVEMFQDIRCWGITKWKWKTLRLKPFFGMGLLTIISY